MVLTVDATPDTRELECSEIKTQVELATGRLGLRRAAQELSFPQMLYQVGLPSSSLAAGLSVQPEATIPEKREVSFPRKPQVLELESSQPA